MRAVALLATLALTRDCPAANDEPPIVGQPAHFNGAVGRFRVAATADKVKVQAEDPLTYTVRVAAEGQARRPPQRPPLAEFPGFADSFYIEDVGPTEGRQPDRQTWEFTYRLKPKATDVKTIPGFPFVFFRPGFLPPRLGYMTVYVKEIPITVTPREAVPTAAKPIAGSDAALALADGDALRHDSLGRLPGPAVLVLMLLAPPLGWVAWYLTWRRLNPAAARLARRRRSRAAQEALKALGAIDHDPDEQARQTAAAVADYLRHRLELPVTDPTPAEAEAHLRRHGISDALAGQTADLLRSCAAVRFDPQPQPANGLVEAASGVILALEAETWSE